ncbi:thiamine-phosphate diphosphorylase [Vibrio hangzhouensis]|uniref:thiamine-phosphate diphosphorylase n=1 Tax=Vibrio hangzhouensis TaxID=462991 RepID=UPI003965796E
MNKFQNLNSDKLRKERIKREHDLLKLNCVTEGEFESRMVIWDRLMSAAKPFEEAKLFIDRSFSKLQSDLADTSRELTVSFAEFETTAKDEINYIRLHVADQKTQLVWYTIIAAMILGTMAICI